MDILPPNEAPITELWAWLTVDDKGDEGIIALTLGDMKLHAVTSKAQLALRSEPLIQAAISEIGLTARLVKFTHKEVIKELTPHER